jgi:hypothetical protein
MDRYLDEHGFKVLRRKPWSSNPGGWVYELAECPFDASHIGGSAAFTRVDGKPGFRCHHNGCRGRNIQDVFQAAPPKLANSATATGWPEIIPLGGKGPEGIAPAAFPGWLGEMALAVSESTETPFDMAALLTLAVASASVAAKADISPEPGYSEPLNLFVCPAMESGNRKTAVFNRLIAPLAAWETSEIQRTDRPRLNLISERRTLEARIDHLRKQAARTDDRVQILREIQQLESALPEVPFPPRLITDDVTPERLASIMHEQGGRIAVFSDEGGIFDILAGRYSRGVPNLDLWLKGHSVSPLRVDRQDRSRPPIMIDKPHLTVGISPQPDVIASLRDKPGFRGRGLLARFLYGLPASRLGYRALAGKPIPEAVELRYETGIRELLEYRPESIQRLRFDPSAYREWKDFQTGLEPQFREGGMLEELKDWGSKLPGAVARIAGVLHLANCLKRGSAPAEIDHSTVVAAAEIGATLISHCRAVFRLMDRDPETTKAERIIGWALRQRSAFFTARDCFRAHQGFFKRMNAMTASLILLEQNGYIRILRPASTGGRPQSEVCEVNPALLREIAP